MAHTAKIAISLPADLLAKVDALAQQRGESRSAFVRRSLEQALGRQEAQQVLIEARRLYAEVEETDRELAEDFLSISAETLPPYSGSETER